MIQAAQIAGAIAILMGFALTQFRFKGTDSFPTSRSTSPEAPATDQRHGGGAVGLHHS